MTQYIVIIPRAWCNKNGCGISYDWDGEIFSTREEAISHGFEIIDCDDFNIGVIVGGEITSLDWMKESVDTEPALMSEIAESIGFSGAGDTLRSVGGGV